VLAQVNTALHSGWFAQLSVGVQHDFFRHAVHESSVATAAHEVGTVVVPPPVAPLVPPLVPPPKRPVPVPPELFVPLPVVVPLHATMPATQTMNAAHILTGPKLWLGMLWSFSVEMNRPFRQSFVRPEGYV
jgi:hypothetical protein